ncbi:5-oxoprolinase subunit C family protein [Alkaliphilus peptidifermentans]|uniref:Biotin-dependent carboxylase uncharacterized domain-containing protein n=1 Tax=Alkaliphilus peptidifermentans DSM 18978 TaxID=1120976 RepID=A0A1G5JZ28_9FIRM|nr:biotin-dependent carboxyltransferase family protein [Alkaliphilus peptidifermentans]SCY93444.1 biotin-dependent carboxylase uncharacterized domain-containing protein [Alkaliphilus peptidifermentans DSM 18978]
MDSIKINKPGLLTTLQDLGREGYQQFGIPVAGAMDKYSFQLANLLVGNDRNEGALEITMMGPEITFNCTSVISITGGDLSPNINNKPIEMYQTHLVRQGDVLKFKGLKSGCRAYLAVAGGFKVDPVMGSVSTFLKGKIGGFKGRRLIEGDVIYLKNPIEMYSKRIISSKYIPSYKARTVRIIIGTEESMFTPKAYEVLLKESYELTTQCDRMGYRLEGPELQHIDGADIISGGINLGAIQVPGEGKPIIMMADRQATGGYAKIANVISVDIPLLAQMKPGDKINFESVSVEEAQKLVIEEENRVNKIKEELQKNYNKAEKIKIYKIKINGVEYRVMVEEIL